MEGLLFACFVGGSHVHLWRGRWVGGDIVQAMAYDNPIPGFVNRPWRKTLMPPKMNRSSTKPRLITGSVHVE